MKFLNSINEERISVSEAPFRGFIPGLTNLDFEHVSRTTTTLSPKLKCSFHNFNMRESRLEKNVFDFLNSASEEFSSIPYILPTL